MFLSIIGLLSAIIMICAAAGLASVRQDIRWLRHYATPLELHEHNRRKRLALIRGGHV